MNELVYRPFTEADIPAARALMRKGYAFIAQYEGFTPEQIERSMATRHSEEAWRDYVATYEHRGVWLGGELVALGVLREDEGRFLYVDPAMHGRGIGRRMMQWAFERVLEKGYACMRITAWRSGMPYYFRYGFQVTSEEKVPQGPLKGHPYVWMERELP